MDHEIRWNQKLLTHEVEYRNIAERQRQIGHGFGTVLIGHHHLVQATGRGAA